MSIKPVQISERSWFPRKVRGQKVWRRACKEGKGHYWEIVRVGHGRFFLDRYLHREDKPRLMLNRAQMEFSRLKNAARMTEEE